MKYSPLLSWQPFVRHTHTHTLRLAVVDKPKKNGKIYNFHQLFITDDENLLKILLLLLSSLRKKVYRNPLQSQT